MERQAMQISIFDLVNMQDMLKEERLKIHKEIGVWLPYNKKFQVNIINKQPKCSDTWEFEE